MQRNRLRQPMKLAGRYDNPIPTQFLAPIDCSKVPALVVLLTFPSLATISVLTSTLFFL
jgi:hypothetical protein